MNAALDLSIPENGTLDDYERIIEENLVAFVRVGLCLENIRDKKLFEAVTDQNGKALGWTEYLRVRWDGMSRAHAGRLINGAETYALLAETFDNAVLPLNERPFRPFVALDVPNEAKVALWAIIQQTAPNGVVTGKHIQLVANTVKEVVVTQHIEDGNGSQVHVSQALKAQITREIFEQYKQEKSYNDTVASTPLYSGHALVTSVEGSSITLELQAAPDVEGGQMVRLLVNELK